MAVMGKVYLITNKINNKKYVGITTKKLQRRFNKHVRENEYQLGDAIKKYGSENFTIKLIEKLPLNILGTREQYWIKHYNTFKGDGYNATKGGCGLKGMKHTAETKQKISKTQTGNYVGKNNPMYGVHLYGEKNGMYNKKHSKETKEKLSKIANQRFNDFTNHPRTKYDKDYYLKIYDEYKVKDTTYKELSNKYNLSTERIGAIVKGKHPATKHLNSLLSKEVV